MIRSPGRTGSVLLLVSGIVAMLAMLATVFLTRMRTDAQEISTLRQQTQCRIMLHAGMAFIQEQSRLGYARMAPNGDCLDPREAWGWIDSRPVDDPPGSGSLAAPPFGQLANGFRYLIGPRGNDRVPLWTAGSWPDVGTSIRCPMYLKRRPPWAVEPRIAVNPIPDDPNDPATFGIPVLKNADPIPLIVPGDGRAEWSRGDPTPDQRSTGFSWFRVYREDGREAGRPANAGPVGATFIITVGGAGSRGYKDWNEVITDGATTDFQGDSVIFDEIVAGEMRQWYRVEWSPAVSGGDNHLYHEAVAHADRSPQRSTFYAHLPVNSSRHRNDQTGPFWDPQNNASTSEARNYIGTIRYIERLEIPPSAW